MACTNPFQASPTLQASGLDPAHGLLKQRIITFLTRAAVGGKVVSGQNCGHADGQLSLEAFEEPENSSGQAPGLMGIDLGWDEYSRNYGDLVEVLAAHQAAGGLVTISMHPPNPYTHGDCRDRTSFDFDDLVDATTPLGRNWQTILNNVANVLQMLKDRHVAVLWRPLHEMNGGWFWWGNGTNWPSPVQFETVWRHMHRYFTVTRQLDNILWVYSPHCQASASLMPTDWYYPGADVVDIVGLDYYGDDLSGINANGSLDSLAALGKPLAICEIGPKTKLDGSFDSLSYAGLASFNISYFLAWHSWPGHSMALPDLANAEKLMTHEAILNRGELDY
jgi:mannan endo-1,4-beta-mannosidase